MSLFDLLWIGIILLWIFRSAVRAGGSSETEQESGEDATERADWRNRLLEAAREWELEQRRRGGELPGSGEAAGGAVATAEEPGLSVATARRPEPDRRSGSGRRSVVVRDVTPERSLPWPHDWEEEAWSLEPTSVPRERSERRPAERRVPEPVAVAAPGQARGRVARPSRRRAPGSPEEPAAAAPEAGRSADQPGPLSRLDRYRTLRRAVVYAEVLGRPKALEDEPISP